MRTSWTTAGLAVIAVVASNVMTKAAEKQDIVETAKGAGSFQTLVAALEAADLGKALKGDGPFTVFAPTDDAFAKLPEGTVETLLKPENKDQLVGILTYHVVSGAVKSGQVVELDSAATLNGQRVDIDASEGVKVDGANLVTADIECSNGVIHVIDAVILPSSKTIPETAAATGKFNTLLAAVKAAGLAETMSGKGPFTVFAPTDAAFAKLPEGIVESLLKPENKQQLVDILKYHVVAGRVYSDQALEAGAAATLLEQKIRIAAGEDGARVNNAKLVSTDLDASNGVIHVIDTVLLPSSDKKQAAAAPAAKPCPLSQQRIVHGR